jgi:hypothetical protein
MTFAATAEVVRYFNATPLLVDCRESDFNMDIADAERRIEQAIASGGKGKVVAIMPVHYGGQVGDVAGVAGLARRFGLKVVEDAAHCCPSYYREEKADSGKQKTELRTAEYAEYAKREGRKTEDGRRKTEDGGCGEIRNPKLEIRNKSEGSKGLEKQETVDGRDVAAGILPASESGILPPEQKTENRRQRSEVSPVK